MNPELRRALAEALLALADDEMILAHRDSEWSGHAPILEEDIAFANIALDEMGHAQLWYRLVAELRDKDPERLPDRLVFRRPASAFRNVRLVELPKGDWAFTIVRQHLFDSIELARLARLAQVGHAPLAQTAAKILNEERYHDRHTRAWMRRLAQGTDESRARIRSALDLAWPKTAQLFLPIPGEERLLEAGVWVGGATLAGAWYAAESGFLGELGLDIEPLPAESEGRDVHTEHLEALLTEMQSVARLEPEAAW